MHNCNNVTVPTDFILFTNVDTGEVGMANADLMGGRTMIIRAMNPIAVTYDPANQVSGSGKRRFNRRSHNSQIPVFRVNFTIEIRRKKFGTESCVRFRYSQIMLY